MNMTFFVTWILWSNQIGLLNSALTSFAWYGSLSFSIPICFHKIRVTTSLHGCHLKCLVSPSMAITTSGCVKLGHCLSFFWSASRHLPCPSVRRDHQQQTKWAGSLHLWELQERPGLKSDGGIASLLTVNVQWPKQAVPTTPRYDFTSCWRKCGSQKHCNSVNLTKIVKHAF